MNEKNKKHAWDIKNPKGNQRAIILNILSITRLSHQWRLFLNIELQDYQVLLLL